MKQSVMILLVLPLALTACVTPYQDPRPPEEQKAQLAAANELGNR